MVPLYCLIYTMSEYLGVISLGISPLVLITSRVVFQTKTGYNMSYLYKTTKQANDNVSHMHPDRIGKPKRKSEIAS
jgi:hypothetical protein